MSSPDGRSELVELAARPIIEEAREEESRDALGRDYDERGGDPDRGCQAPSRVIACDLADGVVRDYEHDLPSAVACFPDDFETCVAHLRLPIGHRRAICTTDLLERLVALERRRLKIIPNAFGEKPVLKPMFGAMIRAAERWRARDHHVRAAAVGCPAQVVEPVLPGRNRPQREKLSRRSSDSNFQQFWDLTSTVEATIGAFSSLPTAGGTTGRPGRR